MPSNSASEKGRENKIYRTPSTPPPDVQLEKEKGFVLDCSAVSSISTDYSKTNPKLGPVIPPYNSQKDKHVDEYFEFIGVNETLEKTGQVRIFFFLFLLWRSHLCEDRSMLLRWDLKQYLLLSWFLLMNSSQSIGCFCCAIPTDRVFDMINVGHYLF